MDQLLVIPFLEAIGITGFWQTLLTIFFSLLCFFSMIQKYPPRIKYCSQAPGTHSLFLVYLRIFLLELPRYFWVRWQPRTPSLEVTFDRISCSVEEITEIVETCSLKSHDGASNLFYLIQTQKLLKYLFSFPSFPVPLWRLEFFQATTTQHLLFLDGVDLGYSLESLSLSLKLVSIQYHAKGNGCDCSSGSF